MTDVGRRAAALAAIVLSVFAAAGCSSSRSTRGVACTTRTVSARTLRSLAVRTAPVTGGPVAAVTTADGRWAFVSETTPSEAAAVEVLRERRGRLLEVRTLPLDELDDGYGIALTHDGRDLVVAGGNATVVLRVSALESGRGQLVAGVLDDGSSGQFEVAISADDRYVFVSDEDTGAVSVFDLARALRDGFSAPGVAVTRIRLANGALGLALSPDGVLLYVTTYGSRDPDGLLWVIDAARAERGRSSGVVLDRVSAGCAPARIAVAPVTGEVWVTTQLSNALLAFSPAIPRDHRAPRLQAVVPVGSEPTGLALVDGGAVALVTNSNRGLIPSSVGSDPDESVSVVDTTAALAHRAALVGQIPAGRFPRDLSVDPATHTVIVANAESGTVETFREPSAP